MSTEITEVEFCINKEYPGSHSTLAFFKSREGKIYLNLPKIYKFWKAIRVTGIPIEELILRVVTHEQFREFASGERTPVFNNLIKKLDSDFKNGRCP
jgi:hypothetical protein